MDFGSISDGRLRDALQQRPGLQQICNNYSEN